MYAEIGAFDAKARLSELLRDVRQGQRYTITVRGEPVADLIPSEDSKYGDKQAAIHSMQNIQKIQGVSAEELVDWIGEGRR